MLTIYLFVHLNSKVYLICIQKKLILSNDVGVFFILLYIDKFQNQFFLLIIYLIIMIGVIFYTFLLLNFQFDLQKFDKIFSLLTRLTISKRKQTKAILTMLERLQSRYSLFVIQKFIELLNKQHFQQTYRLTDRKIKL